MDDYTPIRINPILTIAIIFQLSFLIIAFTLIKTLLTEKPKVARIAINDYSAIQNLDTFPLNDTKKSIIEGELNDIVSINGYNNFINDGANIRADSVHSLHEKGTDVYYLSFIVDLDELKQSYRFVYRDTSIYPNQAVPENSPAIVFCASDEEKKYKDSHCNDNYSENIRDQIIYDMMRVKTFSNFTVGLVGDVYGGEKLSFRINTLSDDQKVISDAVAEVSEYISTLGFSFSDYEYTAGSYVCCSLD